MKKLLIWDGDETLWSGTIANGDMPVIPPERLALLEELSNHGVLQAICSFNRPEDVELVIHRYGLDRWFLHNRCSFDMTARKSKMIEEIIEAYDLTSRGDVVFLDDDAANLAEVLYNIPTIGALTYPHNILTVIEDHFSKGSYTEEDRLRVRRYQSDQQRKSSAEAFGSDAQAFLRSCHIKLEISRATRSDLARVRDLIERAHRMAAISNLMTKLSLESLCNNGRILVGRVKDDYGDYGLSCLAVVGDDENSFTVIDALVVSCRLRGRGVGSALLGWVLNNIAKRPVFAQWEETDYNAGMRSLFEWYGFSMDTIDKYQVVAALRDERTRELPDWVEVTFR